MPGRKRNPVFWGHKDQRGSGSNRKLSVETLESRINLSATLLSTLAEADAYEFLSTLIAGESDGTASAGEGDVFAAVSGTSRVSNESGTAVAKGSAIARNSTPVGSTTLLGTVNAASITDLQLDVEEGAEGRASATYKVEGDARNGFEVTGTNSNEMYTFHGLAYIAGYGVRSSSGGVQSGLNMELHARIDDFGVSSKIDTGSATPVWVTAVDLPGLPPTVTTSSSAPNLLVNFDLPFQGSFGTTLRARTINGNDVVNQYLVGGSGSSNWNLVAGAWGYITGPNIQEPIIVSSQADENDGNTSLGNLSLREALIIANSRPGPDKIMIGPWVRDIYLSTAISTGGQTVEIVGMGANITAIHGPSTTATAAIVTGARGVGDVTIRGLRITGSAGGGIQSNANLTLDQVEIDNNSLRGGVAHQTGNLLVVSSTIAENSNSQASNLNTGGGIGVDTLASNKTVTIINSTVAGNSSSSGAGIRLRQTGSAGPTIRVANSTIADNELMVNGSNIGAGIHADSLSNVFLENSVVAENTQLNGSHQDVGSSVFIVGSHHNMLGYDPSLSNGINNSDPYSNLAGGENGAGILDPMLSVLDNYGGAVRTLALDPNSDAIDAGDPALTSAISYSTTGGQYMTLAFDERGYTRVRDGDNDSTNRIDIGAFEYDGQASPFVAALKSPGDLGQGRSQRSADLTFVSVAAQLEDALADTRDWRPRSRWLMPKP